MDLNRRARVAQSLKSKFQVEYLEIEDESRKHHRGGDETHLRVVLVSSDFVGQSQIQRQRAINQLLQNEFDQGLHALSLKTYTPEEWQKRGGSAPQSPPCAGGSSG